MTIPNVNLVVIGGAEDRDGPCTVLRAFVQRAGGAAARIVVVPSASESSDEVGALYRDTFHRLGVGVADVLNVTSRDDAKRPSATALIEQATAVFFSGGDQLRLMNLIGGTPLDTAIQKRAEEGMVIGGTSAGAAIMSGTMIVEGTSERVQTSSVRTGPGMELLPGVIVDQHFAQRGRIARLLSVVAQFPHNLGIGIDEDTALVVTGHESHVIGSGSVTVLDAGDATFNDAPEVGPSTCITLCHVTLHALPSGRGFDLLERKPIPHPRTLEAS